MADYYPILARAIASLPHNDAQARRELYARARTIVAAQLHERGLPSGAGEALREQGALETAIRKVEAEARPLQAQPAGAPRRPVRRAAAVPAQERADATARSLAKILHAMPPDETSEGALQPPRRTSAKATQENGTRADWAQVFAPAVEAEAPKKIEAKTFNALSELGGAPSSLLTMLFATAYVVAALAFTGVTAIRGAVWLYQGVIGYPILIAIMAVTLALFIVPPVMIFRKASALPTIDNLLRYIHLASRRVL